MRGGYPLALPFLVGVGAMGSPLRNVAAPQAGSCGVIPMEMADFPGACGASGGAGGEIWHCISASLPFRRETSWEREGVTPSHLLFLFPSLN